MAEAPGAGRRASSTGLDQWVKGHRANSMLITGQTTAADLTDQCR